MSKPFKVMLADTLEELGGWGNVTFPLYASAKIDGVRGYVKDGVVYSRSNKPIPNKHVQKLFGRREYEGLDGELAVGPANAKNLMQVTMSGVMSVDGEPNVEWHVFDITTRGDTHTWDQRREDWWPLLPTAYIGERVRAVEQHKCLTIEDVDFWEARYLACGFEGLMLRAPDVVYKQGRCGKKTPWLIKVKRFEDAEAEVIGAIERMHNDNEKFTNELGQSKRSTHQENKRPAGDLGALICRTPEGITFQIGTGFTQQQREELWAEHQAAERNLARGIPAEGSLVPPLVGRTVKYKHFAKTGVKIAPRLPVWLGFRSELDMDAEEAAQ